MRCGAFHRVEGTLCLVRHGQAALSGSKTKAPGFAGGYLLESGVEFVAVDNPHANKLTIHILAAVAQHEPEMVSERTKAALQAAKKRGQRLGNPGIAEAAKLGRAALKANARRFAANVRPIIEEIVRAGATSHNAIAAKLNERNVRTARGGVWTHVQVGAILHPFTGASVALA